MSVCRNSRLAWAEVRRSSHRWTCNLKRRRISSAKACIFSAWIPSAPLMRRGKPITISATSCSRITRSSWAKSILLFWRWRVSNPCAVMPRGSEMARPILLEPTSMPKTLGRRPPPAEVSVWLKGTSRLYVPPTLPELHYDTDMAIDEAEVTRTPLQAVAVPPPKPQKPHWAFTGIGIATVLGLCYWGEVVLAVMLVSVLLAFILAPVMDLLIRLRLPRGLAAAVAVILLLTLLAGLGYYSSNQAIIFVQALSKYTQRIRQETSQVWQRAENLGTLDPDGRAKSTDSRSSTSLADLLTRGFGSLSQALLAASFVPFLVYFMLSWQHHVRSATVMLFSLENRQTAYVTLGLISAMIRTFMVGNLLIGLFLGTASTIAFAILGLPFFYFIGFISGFLSLVPYLGVVLAMAPPFFVSVGHISSGDAVVVVMVVLGLHLIALNVLYPKFLGNRLQLNPLAVTIALLVWGWLWGAMGLVLAVPITAAMKIVFDHIESLKPYGAWMGE